MEGVPKLLLKSFIELRESFWISLINYIEKNTRSLLRDRSMWDSILMGENDRDSMFEEYK